MSIRQLEQLFWEEFDGPTEAERRQRIARLAASSPQTGDRLAELERVAVSLAALEEVAPPPELRAMVRGAIANRPAHDTDSGLIGWLRPLMAARWPARLAYAGLGAALALAGISLTSFERSAVDPAERGRMAGALNVPATQPVSLAFEGGALTLSRDADRLVARLTAPAGELLRLSLSSPLGGLRAARVEPIGAGRHELTAGGGTLELAADGSVAVVVELGAAAGGPLDLRLSVAGEPVLARRFDPDSPTFQALDGNQQ